MIEFNIKSNHHLSFLLFGGKIQESIKEPILDKEGNLILIKSGPNIGKIKLRNTEKTIGIQGFGLKPREEWKNKHGIYNTNEDILKLIASKKVNTQKGQDAVRLCQLLLEIRALNKDISTYYDGISDKIYDDGMVRPTINHTSTGTGRLSQTKPNLQNISGKSNE